MTTAGTWDPLRELLAAHPAKAAVVTVADGVTTTRTFTELAGDAAALSAGLSRLGVAPGDGLAWCGANAYEVIVTGYAARWSGLMTVAVPYRFVAEEMHHLLADSGATVAVVDAARAEAITSLRPRLPGLAHIVVWDGTAPDGCHSWEAVMASGGGAPPPAIPDGAGGTMIYTSGTSGRPKGVVRGRQDPRYAEHLLGTLGMGAADDVHLVTGPLYHAAPLSFALLSQYRGATLVLTPRFDPSAWLRIVTGHRVTNTFCAGTHLRRVVDLPEAELAAADLSSLRSVCANAGPVPYALKVEVTERLGDWFLHEMYGATELGVVAVLPPEDQLARPGSCGQVLPGVEVRITDTDGAEVAPGVAGELYARSSAAMERYHGGPPVVGEWVSVGDVAYRDADGYLYICDRTVDMIISGGVNIYPAEIEAALACHPAVADVAVFGIPDDEWGEGVHAVVETKPGARFDPDDLTRFLDGRLARYKHPRSWERSAGLPRNEMGKLPKRLLRDAHWSGRDRSG